MNLLSANAVSVNLLSRPRQAALKGGPPLFLVAGSIRLGVFHGANAAPWRITHLGRSLGGVDQQGTGVFLAITNEVILCLTVGANALHLCLPSFQCAAGKYLDRPAQAAMVHYGADAQVGYRFKFGFHAPGRWPGSWVIAVQFLDEYGVFSFAVSVTWPEIELIVGS